MSRTDVIKSVTGPDRVASARNEGMKVHDFGDVHVDDWRSSSERQRRSGSVRPSLSVHGYVAAAQRAVADHRRAGLPDSEMANRIEATMMSAWRGSVVSGLRDAASRARAGKTATSDTLRPVRSRRATSDRCDWTGVGHRRANRCSRTRVRPANGRCPPATTRAHATASSLRSLHRTPRNLHVSWAFSTGVLRGHEGQPLVVGNTMYVVTPYPNVVVRDRSRAAGPAAQMEIPSRERAAGDRSRVLRCRESRRRIRGRKNLLQPARRSHGRRRCGDRASRSGARRWAISRAARRSPWRRSS